VLAGVAITVPGDAEYGRTFSQLPDGEFSMAVNGGSRVTIQVAKSGYLPVQRSVYVPWNEYVWLPEVALVRKSTGEGGLVWFGPGSPDAGDYQAVQGRLEPNDATDGGTPGARVATLIFAPETTATLETPDGGAVVNQLTVRVTEYTVGPDGEAAMPADLPAGTGYTYAMEVSADEADDAGAKGIVFDKPVAYYVDNLAGLPVGTIVPAGRYDRERGVWIPEPNGRVVRIVGIDADNLAHLDIDGADGGAADDPAAIGATSGELRKLGEKYAEGAELWRVPMTHFSPGDLNLPWGPPPGSVPPSVAAAAPVPDKGKPKTDCGSIVEPENRVLRERIEIPGAPFTLNYNSMLAPGWKTVIEVPVSGDGALPASLKSFTVELEIAGKKLDPPSGCLAAPLTPNRTCRFLWDGKDLLRRRLQGSQPFTGRVTYRYPGRYQQPAENGVAVEAFKAFGALSGVDWLVEQRTVSSRGDFTSTRTTTGTVNASAGGFDARPLGLGGWTLSTHQIYDPVSRTLLSGNGERRPPTPADDVVVPIAGNGDRAFDITEASPALDVPMEATGALAYGPDGQLYFTDGCRIRALGTDGKIRTLAGGDACGFSDGRWPPVQGTPVPQFALVNDLAVGPDATVFLADTGNTRIRSVHPDGTVETLAGNGGVPPTDPTVDDGNPAEG